MKNLLIYLGIISGTMLAGATPNEVRSYSASPAKTLVYSNGFEDPADPNFRFSTKGMSIAKGEGINGTSALKITRTGKNEQTLYGVISGFENLKPDMKYVVSYKVRCENVGTRGVTRPLIVEFRDRKTGKFVNGVQSVSNRWFKENDFVSDEFSLQFDNNFIPIIVPRLSRNLSGTIWLDDVEIHSQGEECEAVLSWPSGRRFANSGKFKINIYTPITPKVKVLVSLFREEKKLYEKIIAVNNKGIVSEDFGIQPEGKATLNVIVFDEKRRMQLGTFDFQVEITKQETPPAHAVIVNKDGRLLVDGKPYMVIASFCNSSTHSVMPPLSIYKDMADAGFNTFIDYAIFSLKPSKNASGAQLENVSKVLDDVNKLGLKTLFCLQGAQTHSRKRKLDGKNITMPEMTKRTVEALKNHPAILGWYLDDETPPKYYGQIATMRKIINEMDPWHPTLFLTYEYSHFPAVCNLADIITPDQYPISGTRVSIFPAISQMMRRVTTGGIPIWGTIQAFNRGFYGAKTPEQFKKYLYPSLQDIRAMTYLYAIEGATGFIFYTYAGTDGHIAKATELGAPDYFQKLWPPTCAAVADLRRLEPFIMSVEKAPEIKVELKGKGRVEARLFKTAKGKYALLIASVDPMPSEAIVTLPPQIKLKSTYGQTVSLGNGKYRFTSKDIDGDMLFE